MATMVLRGLTVLALVVGLLVPGSAGAAPGDATFDGDPATTERIVRGDPTTAAVALSQARFADAGARTGRRADYVVLSRDDDFPDSLAGAALTDAGPLLFTTPRVLTAATANEIARVLPPGGRVYLLGGTGAISAAVEDGLRDNGYEVVRLAGATRVETALAVADAVRARHPGDTVLVARAEGTDDNPGSGWADSVTGGAYAAARAMPVVVTPTDALHPAVAAWLDADAPARTVLLGGPAALSGAVERAVPNARRVSGVERTATAAAIVRDLWALDDDGRRNYVVVNGEHPEGWAYGLAAAGLAADAMAPMVLVTDRVTPATRALVAGCGAPEVDLTVVGDGTVVPGATREHLDTLDGAACGPNGELRTSAALTSFDSCAQTEAYFREAAIERVSAFGLYAGGFAGGGSAGEDTAAEGGDYARAVPAPAASQPGQDFSGTNNQEAGVDEADFVKTNGDIALIVANNRLQVVDVSAGEAPERLAALDLPQGYGHQLFLSGDRALVLSRGDAFSQSEPEGGDVFIPSYEPKTVLTLVDLANPSAPEVLESAEVDGDYRSARLVGGAARIVVVSQPSDLTFTYPENESREAFASAAAHNRDVVADATAANWLPSVRTSSGEEPLVACDDVSQPPGFSGLGTVTVFTVDVAAGLQPTSSASVVGNGDIVYASTQSLYVTTSRWTGGEPGFVGEPVSTEIHAFDIADAAATTYRASGRVAGYVLNQFSLSEHAGHLRVATTTQPAFDDPGAVSESAVVVLAAQDGALVEVGRVGGLGLGERIYAVRFLGDLGAVVTFREIDPLYLLDLADPTNPRLLGELKIPGYSAYLHRVNDDLLLGVGQDATEDGRTTGAQVSLFDIADRANPQRVATVPIGGSTEVEFDHKAFLYWDPTGLAVVPTVVYGDQGAEFLGAVGVDVDPAARTLAEAGRVSHTEGQPDAEEDFRAVIRRAFVVGDTLYSVSDAGLEAADLDTLDEEAFVPFE
jgi:uncharacterized secreted protein with C-terminal beta-propeller domain/putative cell wall-binding protein